MPAPNGLFRDRQPPFGFHPHERIARLRGQECVEARPPLATSSNSSQGARRRALRRALWNNALGHLDLSWVYIYSRGWGLNFGYQKHCNLFNHMYMYTAYRDATYMVCLHELVY